jgi:hypothetical protein
MATADPRLDDLAQRGVDAFVRFTRKGVRFGLWFLAFVIIGCVGGFVLGIAALSGTAQTLWIIVGGVFLVIGIGSTARAVFRLWLVGRASAALVGEVRTVIGQDPAAERVVIDTVETSERSDGTALMVSQQQFGQWQTTFTSRAGDVTSIALAIAALLAFPRFIGIGLLVTMSFMALGFLFAIAIIV